MGGDDLEFYDACWCAGTGCGGHLVIDVTERLADELIGDVSGWRPTGVLSILGAAQHTYTRACDGLHEPGPCPVRQQPYTVRF